MVRLKKRYGRAQDVVTGTVLLLALCACTQIPQLDSQTNTNLTDTPYPALVPVETLLDGSVATEEDDTERAEQLEQRAAGLQSRAAQLQRRSSIPNDTRQKLDAGISVD